LILGLLAAGVEAREHFARCVNRSITPAERCYCLGGWARQLAEENPRQAQAVLGEALTVSETERRPLAQCFLLGRPDAGELAHSIPFSSHRDSWKALNDVEALRRAQGPASQAGCFRPGPTTITGFLAASSFDPPIAPTTSRKPSR